MIVTNAKLSWITSCSTSMMPLTAELLADQVPVISARDDHSDSEQEVKKWKVLAMKKLLMDKTP